MKCCFPATKNRDRRPSTYGDVISLNFIICRRYARCDSFLGKCDVGYVFDEHTYKIIRYS